MELSFPSTLVWTSAWLSLNNMTAVLVILDWAKQAYH